MIKGGVLDPTGYGISINAGDGEDRIVEVDIPGSMVLLSGGDAMSFTKYCEEKREWSPDSW